MLVLPTNPGTGYFGYIWYYGQHTYYAAGYPTCNSGSQPALCGPFTLWWDGPCQEGEFSEFGGGTFRSSCDTSPGHSGGPLYFYGGSGPYITGVYSKERCAGATCASQPSPYNVRPNLFKAMTSDLASYISYLRSLY